MNNYLLGYFCFTGTKVFHPDPLTTSEITDADRMTQRWLMTILDFDHRGRIDLKGHDLPIPILDLESADLQIDRAYDTDNARPVDSGRRSVLGKRGCGYLGDGERCHKA
ncbi:MAG: hypothetical protein KGL40_12570 [Rhodocyclaceae bacterium]|nr:hypothetical protein [Rhodocyclaceae bacterium]